MIDDILQELVESLLSFDAPKKLSVSAQEALQRRISPYKNIAGAMVLLYLLFLIALLFWVICMPCPPYPWGNAAAGSFAFYMLAATLGIGLINATAALLFKHWHFADFHTAVAYHLNYGPHGLSLALVLWGLLLSILYLAHINV
ncbi:MAG: hypothetical protein E7030_06835 [Akkermansiaceae bacterium]|nr:hypothetical protein [Akkermansiaceae bacterium]